MTLVLTKTEAETASSGGPVITQTQSHGPAVIANSTKQAELEALGTEKPQETDAKWAIAALYSSHKGWISDVDNHGFAPETRPPFRIRLSD